MTTPTPNSAPAPPRPPRLAFLTTPLTIFLIWNALELLMLSFNGEQNIRRSYEMAVTILGGSMPPITTEQVKFTLWITFILLILLILWLYNTRRGLLEGKSWGRVSAIVIAICSLLVFPIGTALAVFMLIGAFDRDVTNYTSR